MALHTYNTVLKYGATSPTTPLRIKDFPTVLGKREEAAAAAPVATVEETPAE
jgi:hypothetical protein